MVHVMTADEVKEHYATIELWWKNLSNGTKNDIYHFMSSIETQRFCEHKNTQQSTNGNIKLCLDCRLTLKEPD